MRPTAEEEQLYSEDVMSGKLRDLSWKELPRASQQGSILYPDLVDPTVQRGMLDRAAEDGRPKNLERLQDRMGGEPKPAVDYSRVPGLVRVVPKATGPKSWWNREEK